MILCMWQAAASSAQSLSQQLMQTGVFNSSLHSTLNDADLARSSTSNNSSFQTMLGDGPGIEEQNSSSSAMKDILKMTPGLSSATLEAFSGIHANLTPNTSFDFSTFGQITRNTFT